MPLRNELATTNPEYSPKTYPTTWGEITFEEFYIRTRKIVAYRLQKGGLDNPQDIDDAMQAAYLKIWRKLETKAELFADKPLQYIIRSIYFQTKVERFSQYRHNRKLISGLELEQSNRESISIEQLETWIDLQAAIVTVAQMIYDVPHALMALYSLITEVEVHEVASILGCSSKTMTKYRNRMRKRLVQHLPYYSQTPEISPLLSLAKVSIVNTLLNDLM